MGGASILKAVSNGCDFDAIIIESVFSDIRTAARNRLETRFGLLGGILDSRAKPWEARAIFDRLPTASKRIRIIAGAGHQDLFDFDYEAYRNEILIFCPASKPPPMKRPRMPKETDHRTSMIVAMENLFEAFLVAIALGSLLGFPVHGQSQYYGKGKDGIGLSYAYGFGEGGKAHTAAASLVNKGRTEIGGSFSLITSESNEEELYADRSWGLNFGWNMLKHSPGFPVGLMFQADYLNSHYSDAEESGIHTRATGQTLSIGVDPYFSIPLKSHGRIHLNTGYHHIMSSAMGVGGGIEQGIPIQVKYVVNHQDVSKIAIGGGAMLFLQSGTAAGSVGITYLLHEKD